MSILDTIEVNDFKTQFPRWSPMYLPVYKAGTYAKNAIVYYNGLFYQVIVNSTSALPTVTTDWQVYNTTKLNYTLDSDIENAFKEASVNFNEGLFPDECTAKLIFLYLTAYYLTVDFQNALGGSVGIVQSKSVGSVSESYAIPQWMLNSTTLSMYASNGYGRKYLTLIKPYITGNIILAKGATTVD